MTKDKGKTQTQDMSEIMGVKPYGSIGPNRTTVETRVIEKMKKKKKVEVAEGSTSKSGVKANAGECSKAIGNFVNR